MPDQDPDRLQALRETMAMIIGLVILGVSMWMFVVTYRTAQQSAGDATKTEAFNREKDLTLLGLTLLGAVLGYYFGRVPAELRAHQAQRMALAAQTQLSASQDKLAEAVGVAEKAIRERDRVNDDREKIKTESRDALSRVLEWVVGAQDHAKNLSFSGPAQSNELARVRRDIEIALGKLA